MYMETTCCTWAHGVVGYHIRLAYLRLRGVLGSIPSVSTEVCDVAFA